MFTSSLHFTTAEHQTAEQALAVRQLAEAVRYKPEGRGFD